MRMMQPNQKKVTNIIDEAVKECRSVFKVALLFSLGLNALMIALPIYSMQILDRVMSSGSYETLFMLTALIIGLFIALAMLSAARTSALSSVSEWLDKKLGSTLLALSISSASTRATASGSQNLRDLGVLKSFLIGQGMTSLFDAPWALIYLLIIFIIHPVLGLVTSAGGIILLVLAVFNEYAMREPIAEANELSITSLSHAEISTRNSEVVEAMGMGPAVIKQWEKVNNKVIALQTGASARSGTIIAITKFARMVIQVLILGGGTILALNHMITSGAIIAASILASRALAPFEAAISVWKTTIDARKAYERLRRSLSNTPVREKSLALPKPLGKLLVEKVIFGTPTSGKPILKGVGFTLEPGEVLGIIGPSASGKSTLAKLITGVWRPSSGVIRLDNADVYSWEREDFGRHVGYVPQDIELFRGTVKENIARMQEDVSDEAIVAAAQAAGAHEMILHLSKGYETDIGIGGALLSGGQRQRVALARAFFGDPKLVILDEPNANLDEMGELALVRAVQNAKAKKITTIVISHRQNILSVVDKIMVMKDGLVEAYGPTQEIFARYSKKPAAPQQPQEVTKDKNPPQLAEVNKQ